MTLHADIFKSAPTMYSRGMDKTELLHKLLGGFDDLCNDMELCLAGCQKPVNTMEEFEDSDGDLASNMGTYTFCIICN